MTVEMIEYGLSDRLQSLLDRDVLDGMVQQAMGRWQQRNIELGNGVYACRMMAGPYLVVFFMLENEGKVTRRLMLWEEAEQRNIAPALLQLFNTGDVRDGPGAFLREYLKQGG